MLLRNLLVGTRNQSTRDKWLKEILKKIPPNSRILDAGAGEQQYKSLCSHLNYVSQDFAQYDGKGDGVGKHTGRWDYKNLDIISDITSIPEPNNSFDALMCTEVFEHIPEPIIAIQEFSRLLKPNGHLILTAPFCSLSHFTPYHYYTGFSKYFYKTFLSKYGFNIIEIQPNGNFFEYLAQEIRRIPQLEKRYTRKMKFSLLGWLKKKFYYRFLVNQILLFLGHYSSKDYNSSELLNFGFHVYARKKV